VAVIRPANVLFEVDGVTEAVARESLRLAPQAAHQNQVYFASPEWADFAMKQSQRKEVHEKTLPELLADGRNMRQEIFNLRLQQASAQLEKPARFAHVARDIARIETGFRTPQKKRHKSVWLKPHPIWNPPAAKRKSAWASHLQQDDQDHHRAGRAALSASKFKKVVTVTRNCTPR